MGYAKAWKRITLRSYGNHAKLHKNAMCERCGKKLEIGEEVMRHRSSTRRVNKYYHIKCYKELWR